MARNFQSPKGEAHHAAKLTEGRVKASRKLYYENGLCIRCIAKLYNISYTTMWDAINYVTWKSVK
jgi:predicted DNA-binding protein YlxM (UPF0122 family)